MKIPTELTPEQERLFEERMARKRAEEEVADAARAEQERQDYLRRTGRTELKP